MIQFQEWGIRPKRPLRLARATLQKIKADAEISIETPASPTSQTEQPSLAGQTAPAANKPLPDLPPNARAADGSEEYESNLVDLLDLIGMPSSYNQLNMGANYK